MGQKTTLEILQDARAWITDPNHWCAFNRWHGERNCALGALERAGGLGAYEKETFELFPEAIGRLAAVIPIIVWAPNCPKWLANAQTVAEYNNIKGHAATLKMFDDAIELEKKMMDEAAKKLIESVPEPEGVLA